MTPLVVVAENPSRTSGREDPELAGAADELNGGVDPELPHGRCLLCPHRGRGPAEYLRDLPDLLAFRQKLHHLPFAGGEDVMGDG